MRVHVGMVGDPAVDDLAQVGRTHTMRVRACVRACVRDPALDDLAQVEGYKETIKTVGRQRGYKEKI